jgi:uncharacterized protein YbjQ (UPF0145 family)
VSAREPGAGAEPVETPAQEADEQAELERIEAGGIPTAAERRLKELRGKHGAFTSDLSVGGFALCHKLGLKPLSQVMGSSIYQVGYQGMSWPMMYSGVATELQVLSEAWNEVRRRALNRLEQEATHAGADAVVGVQVRTAYHEWAEGALEYVVLGTAVSRAGAKTGGHPVMTELSVADYAKLLNAGVEPLGIVAWTSVFFVAGEEMAMSSGLGGRMMFNVNEEMRGFTQGVYSAREQTMERLGYQAQQLGANGIVGVRISHTMRPHDVGGGGVQGTRRGLMITFEAIGTAVRDTAATSVAPPLTKLDLSDQ